MLVEYKNNLQIQKNSVVQQSAQDNVLKFYRENKDNCEKIYWYYKEYNENKNKFIDRPHTISKGGLLDIIKGRIIFIMTANPIEEAVLMRSLSAYFNLCIPSYRVGDNVYQVIVREKYTLVHNHTLKTGDEFTRRSINYATKVFSPDYIILLGICYGIDFKKYDLGTVLVSDNIEGFRINFRDQEDNEDTLFEAETEFEEKPNRNLINLMSNFFNVFQSENDFFSKKNQETQEIQVVNIRVVIGQLLSSNSLMSSKKVKDAVMSALGAKKRKPLGGEMEACGVFKSNFFDDKEFSNWLVIKSICDWGEKKNSLSENEHENEKIKDSIQAYAMMNTWIIFKTILENELLIEGR